MGKEVKIKCNICGEPLKDLVVSFKQWKQVGGMLVCPHCWEKINKFIDGIKEI